MLPPRRILYVPGEVIFEVNCQRCHNGIFAEVAPARKLCSRGCAERGRTTDFFGVGGRLSLTPRFSEVGVAREQAPQPLQRFTVAGKPLKRFRPRDHRPHPTKVGC